MRSHPLQDTC